MPRSDSEDTADMPLPNPDVVSRRLGDDTVLVHLKTNRIFALNPTGARFWELLLEGMNRGEIEQYAAPAEIYLRPRTAFALGFVGHSTQFQGRAGETAGIGVQTRQASHER